MKSSRNAFQKRTPFGPSHVRVPAKLNEDLAKLERYEKRAFLRRKRALDRMDTLK
jgi:hypothetical protein